MSSATPAQPTNATTPVKPAMVHQPPRSVLILSSKTGGGHISTADSLKQALLEAGVPQVHIRHVLEESTVVNRTLVNLYNYLLRHRQGWMQAYYGIINLLRLNERAFLLKSMVRYAQGVLQETQPDLIVSVHPMMQPFYPMLLKEAGLNPQVPLLTVVTDPCYGFWKGWASPLVAQYSVASEGAKQQLEDYGIAPSAIKVVGMPLRPHFKRVPMATRLTFRQHYGLAPDRLTLFVNAGWVGGGNIPTLFEYLIEHAGLFLQERLQVVFLAGHNPKLHQWAQALASKALFPVLVLDAQAPVHELMQMSDIMLSKAGGLTTFEALSCGLPMLVDHVTPPMPQERHTAHFVQACGAGVLVRSPMEVLRVLHHLLHHPQSLEALREAALEQGTPQALAHIVDLCLNKPKAKQLARP
jgi:UDP-N-acetylglucosamine:LPS N-acetylglucosamine transferase